MGTTELLSSEFVMMKDTVWKLSSRVLLLEGFIKQQFGNVFWQFCEDQVKGGGGGGGGGEAEGIKSEDSQPDQESEEEEEELSDVKPSLHPHTQLPMPPMIPIIPKKAASAPPSTQAPPPTQAPPTVQQPLPRKTNSIPPPPPLSLMRGSSFKPRNFLPKSLSSSGGSKTTPKLPPSITITPTTHIKANGRIPPPPSRPQGVSILKEKISENLSDSLEQYSSNPTPKTRPTPPPPALIMSRQGRISSSNSIQSHTHRGQSLLLAHHQFYSQEEDPDEEEEEYYGGADSGEYYGGGGGHQSGSPSEEEDPETYGDGGYLAAELVSATLCPPEEDGDQDQEGCDYDDDEDPEGGGGVHKKIRLSLGAASSSGSSYMNGSGNGSGGGTRQMRPNPCHARCQNRCHDIWTDGDRMGVFQTYWAIPNEEERREFVASRIERVDMATKRTEFSNFRTCTFKYYLPHPENAWVQVCKNFFLATIDEKRSYIEKIAQSVKGDAGVEKVSTKNIPFRRRNQMQRSVEDSYAGWMQGLGLDPSLLDDPQGQGLPLQGMGGYEGDDQDQDDNDGMEIMEDETEAPLQD